MTTTSLKPERPYSTYEWDTMEADEYWNQVGGCEPSEGWRPIWADTRMTTNDIMEFLGMDSSVNGQTLELGHISPEEWASWLTHLGYRWQVQVSRPWGHDLHTDMESLFHETLNEVRIVHSDKIATFRERID